MQNLHQYADFKDRNATRLVKLTEKTIALSCKRFDPASGEPAEPIIMQISMESVDKLIAQRKAELASLEALRADMQELK